MRAKLWDIFVDLVADVLLRPMHSLVKLVAFVSPILAPIPSAYFVASATQTELHAPQWVAVVVALVVEGLGITSIHAALSFTDWNTNRREGDPPAPTGLAVILGGAYILVTIGLTVFLKIIPQVDLGNGWIVQTATIATAILPLMAAVGAFNLALLGQHEKRIADVEDTRERERLQREEEKRLRREERLRRASPPPPATIPDPLPEAPEAPRRVLTLVPEPHVHYCKWCDVDLGDPSNKSRIGGHEGNCPANPSAQKFNPEKAAEVAARRQQRTGTEG